MLWSWKANTYDEATIKENISLWEGVWSSKASTYDQATITENISLWEGVWSWKANTYNKATITENISLWEGVVVLKGQYIQSSYNNRKYFTLGGCLVLKWEQAEAGSPHTQITPLAPISLQVTPACSQMPMNSLVCIWVPTTSGGQRARGQGGRKLKLTPFTPRSLPSIPSHSCHFPHSQLTRPHSQCPMNSLLCIAVSTTSGGKGLGGQHGSKLKLAPLAPTSLQLTPACTELTPSLLQLTPSLL